MQVYTHPQFFMLTVTLAEVLQWRQKDSSRSGLRWKYPSTYGTFMRCIAVGCTTQSQPKYAIFLGRLFHCTFKWSQEDLKPLIPAIHCKLTRSGVKDPSEEDVIKKSAKKSLRPIATEKPLVWKKQLTWSMTWWTDFKMSKEMTL